MILIPVVLTTTWGTLDNTGEYMAIIFMANQDMTVSHIGWRTGTVAGSPTADTRIETVDTATGNPSGTLWAANTNIVSGALSSNTWTLHALTASATITRGQVVCIKVVWNGTTPATDSFIVQRHWSRIGIIGNSDFPYQVTNTSGSAVKASFSGNPLMAVGSSTTSFYLVDCLHPVSTTTQDTHNNTNSAARALRFQLPYSARCIGMHFNTNGGGDVNIGIMNDAGTELSSSSTAIDKDISTAATFSSCAYFDNAVTLSANTWYRAFVEPSSATNITSYYMTLPSSNYRSGTFGGTNHHWATRASGTWTDSNTDRIPL